MLNAIPPSKPAGRVPPPLTAARSEAEVGGGGAGVGRLTGSLHARASLALDASDLLAAWLEAIHEARTTLKISAEVLAGAHGPAITQALAHRAAQGVRVQILAWGARTPEREAGLAAARGRGLLVRQAASSAVAPGGNWLVADDRVALLGHGTPHHGRVARAGVLRMAGEAAWELGRAFNFDWAAAGGAPAHMPEPPAIFASTSGAFVRLGGAGGGRRNARAVLIGALEGARLSIDVGADVVADPAVIAALRRAQARGVPVRVLVDEGALRGGHDLLARLGLDDASLALAALQRAGLEVGVLTAGALTLRAAVIDEATVAFGTAPWTQEGLDAPGEWLVTVQDAPLAGFLAGCLEADREAAHLVPRTSRRPARALNTVRQAVKPVLAALSRLAAQGREVPELRVGVVRIAGRWRLLAESGAR